MIVSPQEYNSLKQQIRDPNEYSHLIRLPSDEHIYNINLNDRKIEAPDFLSVETDMNGEIIWFKADRFFDDIDLFSGDCWIFYTNAANESHFYSAKIQVFSPEIGNDYILIPWVISKDVAQKNGAVNFSIQFFKLSEDGNRFLYIVNTLPAKSKILTNQVFLEPTDFLTDDTQTEVNVLPEREALAMMLRQLSADYKTLSGKYELYWTEISD